MTDIRIYMTYMYYYIGKQYSLDGFLLVEITEWTDHLIVVNQHLSLRHHETWYRKVNCGTQGQISVMIELCPPHTRDDRNFLSPTKSTSNGVNLDKC